MRKATLIKTGVASAAALAIAAGLAAPANANPQAQTNDVVIVGSDTAQFLANFVADGMSSGAGMGATVGTGGTALTAGSGFNKTAQYRIYSYDATADGLGRTMSMAAGANPGVILRAGSAPTHLPNGSGDGYSVFAADTSGSKQIDFVRGSRAPNTGDISAMTTAGDSYHTWKIAKDGMQIAVNSASSNAPTAGLTTAQLNTIYEANPTVTNWTQAGGTGTDLIVPLLPQDGSGTHDDFLNSILGSKTTPANAHLVRTQEHDPSPLTPAGFTTAIEGAGGALFCTNDGTASGTPVTWDATAKACPSGSSNVKDAALNSIFLWQSGQVTVADAISPFSVGRYNLIQKGYFDVNKSAVGDPAWTNAIKLLPFDTTAGTGYFFQRYLYLSARDSAFGSSVGWQPGTSANKISTVVAAFQKSLNAPLFTDAGVTQNFADCGVNMAIAC